MVRKKGVSKKGGRFSGVGGGLLTELKSLLGLRSTTAKGVLAFALPLARRVVLVYLAPLLGTPLPASSTIAPSAFWTTAWVFPFGAEIAAASAPGRVLMFSPKAPVTVAETVAVTEADTVAEGREMAGWGTGLKREPKEKRGGAAVVGDVRAAA